MINIDDRLLEELNGNEIAVFVHILKRININKTSFPSVSLLSKETTYGRDKVRAIINSLVDKSVIKKEFKSSTGKFTKTVYTVTTKLAGVYIAAEGYKFKDINPEPEYQATATKKLTNKGIKPQPEIPSTEKTILSINQSISINHLDTITSEVQKTSDDGLDQESHHSIKTEAQPIQKRKESSAKEKEATIIRKFSKLTVYEKKKLKFVDISKDTLTEEENDYYLIAGSFIQLMINYTKSVGAKTTNLENTNATAVDTIRLMMEDEGFTREEMIDIYKALKSTPFWHSNIQSMASLRKQANRLLMIKRTKNLSQEDMVKQSLGMTDNFDPNAL